MKDKFRWIERGVSLVLFLAVLAGWVINATVVKTRAETDMAYLKGELTEMKEDLKEVKGTVKDININVNENANNITMLTTLAKLDSE